MNHFNARNLATLALGTTLAAAAAAQAPYYKRSLPDYDQKRIGLANSGKNHCVPTSYVNLFKFMGQNGLPDMDDTYTNGYSDITAFINQIGMNMGTSGQTGTGGNAAFNAAVAWTNARASWFTLHFRYGQKDFMTPETLRNVVSTGALVDVCYGRYHFEGGMYVRKSGHCVSLAGYDWRFAQKSLLVADPAADGGDSLSMQSPFSIDAKPVYQTALNISGVGVCWLPRYTGWTGDDGNWQAAVDYVHGILPIWSGAFKGVTTTAPGAGAKSMFEASIPAQIADGVNEPVRSLTAEIDGAVADWCMDHGDMAVYALMGDGSVTHLDLVSRRSERVAAIPGAKRIVVAGADRSLYALVEVSSTADRLVRIDRKSGRQTSLSVPKGLTALEPDPMTQGLILLNPTAKALVRVDELLRGATSRAVSLPEGTGALFLAPERSGAVTIARSGARTLVKLGVTGGVQTLTMAAPMALRDFQSAGNGFYLAQDGAKLVTLDAMGRPGASQFDGKTSEARVRFAQSWDAMKPGDIEGPGWRDELPVRGQP